MEADTRLGAIISASRYEAERVSRRPPIEVGLPLSQFCRMTAGRCEILFSPETCAPSGTDRGHISYSSRRDSANGVERAYTHGTPPRRVAQSESGDCQLPNRPARTRTLQASRTLSQDLGLGS
jgi:hypothetical protein